jgi:hypothetical protein
MGASALAAALLFAKSATLALTPGHFAGDTLAPAVIAVLLIVLIIFLRVTRADRR